MPYSLATLRKDLATTLRPVLPAGWRYATDLNEPSKTLVPVVQIIFTRVTPSAPNGDLPVGTVAAHADLRIYPPEQDITHGEDTIDAGILELIHGIDPLEDLYWESADKEREVNADGSLGRLYWRVSTIILSHHDPKE